MVAEVSLGKVGAVCAREVSRFARNSRDWQQLIEMCRVVDTVLIDQETIYAPQHGNDRLLLGLKGSLNEYELDLLRQRSLSARYEKARRGELVGAPVGFVKAGDHYEKDPDRLPETPKFAGHRAGLRQGTGARQRTPSSGVVPRA
jgi:DNA invertase Pin-like site-specific DNA recombinase